ncbi:MAG: PBSX family phage terminase large subunit, partial [Planctomycetes bacterium]|nr:PBSX family phage terminase large subunit [Planctomycetota bacterium]
ESVHQVLCDEIKRMGLEAFFQIKNDSIIGLNGSEFIFAGIRTIDITKVKSMTNIHIAWVEEGQVVSEKSWEILGPTIRGVHPEFGDAEIWTSFNPELDTDPTYIRLIEQPQPGSIVVKVNYSDNPFFPDVLEQERLHLHNTDKTHGRMKYNHTWEGECVPAVEGAIFANEIARLHEQSRVRLLDYDNTGLLYGVMDLGWGVMSLVLVQRFASTVQIVGYREWTHTTYHEMTLQLKKEFPSVRWGKIYMPHDASHKDPKYGKSHKDVMTHLGWDVADIPQ